MKTNERFKNEASIKYIKPAFLVEKNENGYITPVVFEREISGGIVDEGKTLNSNFGNVYASASKEKWFQPTEKIIGGFNSLSFSADDSGNVERFLLLYGDRVRFSHKLQSFFTWNGKFWEKDDSRRIKALCENAMKQYRAAAEKFRHSYNLYEKQLFQHSCVSCNNSRLNALVDMLKHQEALAHDDFDIHTFLLNVGNGTINLRTGDLLPYNKQHFLTYCLETNYDRDGMSDNGFFKRFVMSICCENEALADYMQVCFGYGITAETNLQVMFLLHGEGANGKTTLLEAIANVVGDYVKHIPIEVLIGATDTKNGTKATPELAQVMNARMLFASETNAGDVFNEGKIKNLTGSSTISVRQLYQKPFEFVPKFKLFIDCNHLPKIKGNDYSIWRRLKVIPFKATFKGQNVNFDLPKQLKDPLVQEEILNWLVVGAVRYYTEGLPEAPQVSVATSEYKTNSDTVGQFVSSCVKHECKVNTPSAELYTAYVKYCETNELIPTNITDFGRNLSKIGLKKKRTASGIVYTGISV